MTEVAEVRAALVQFSNKLIADRLCIGSSGNLSIRVGDRIFITPSSTPPCEMAPEQIAETDLAGTIVEATARPSTELPLHTAIYNASAAGAVVHTHSMFATVLSTTHEELPAVHYMINQLGGPVRVVPYCTFGTAELAQRVRAGIQDRFATLIQNHGTVTYGATLAEAYARAQLLEWLAELYVRGLQIGAPRILSVAELAEVRAQGQRLRYEFGNNA
jgi:L-fuculose-phosphate aldolase